MFDISIDLVLCLLPAILRRPELFVTVIVRAYRFSGNSRRFSKYLPELQYSGPSYKVKGRFRIFYAWQVYRNAVISLFLDHRFSDPILVDTAPEHCKESIDAVRRYGISRCTFRLQNYVNTTPEVQSQTDFALYGENYVCGNEYHCQNKTQPPFVSFYHRESASLQRKRSGQAGRPLRINILLHLRLDSRPLPFLYLLILQLPPRPLRSLLPALQLFQPGSHPF